jgi:putative ATPase
MDLFAFGAQAEREQNAPLAHRMRPQNLDDVVGQADVVGPGTMLRRMIERDRLMSLIFFGPPGCGKTTLAEVIANVTKAAFVTLNAVSSGVADIRKTVEEAKEAQSMYSRRTVVFIDEIHRFNKAQQDALLPHVEAGLVTLIGATTENPFIQVNPALVSRSHIIRLSPLSGEALGALLDRALADSERGLGNMHAHMDNEAKQWIVQCAGGDARRALNALEMAAFAAAPDADGHVLITKADAESVLGERQVLYDRDGDEHYDTISAFIKSVRGSDPDAAVLWLAKMIRAGEDPRFIARRLIILASEDIGNADPNALSVAVSALAAVEHIGMPEGRIVLAQATTYLATAPKSNAAYNAVNKALADIENGLPLRVPVHLRGSNYQGAKRLGHGEGYLYPHDYEGHFVAQNYWPEGVEPRTYYVRGERI